MGRQLFFLVSRKPPNPAGFLGAYLHEEKGHKIREIRHYQIELFIVNINKFEQTIKQTDRSSGCSMFCLTNI